MATYAYINDATGEKREIIASMKDPPPEWIQFMPESGGWIPAKTTIEEVRENQFAHLFRRVYGNFEINAKPVSSKFPVVSRVLPRWMPGARHDKLGRPIIENAAHQDRIAKTHNYVQDQG